MRRAALLVSLLLSTPALAGSTTVTRARVNARRPTASASVPPARAPAPAAPAPATTPPAAPKPAMGTSVHVVVVAGALTIEEVGHVVPCSRDAVCAVVPSGKHVEGEMVDGKLFVVAP